MEKKERQIKNKKETWKKEGRKERRKERKV